MASMSKKEMTEAFRELLDTRKQMLKDAAEKHLPSATMLYGEIWGVADSMGRIGLIDYEQAEHIKNEARAIRDGKEPEYEPC